MQPQNLNLPLTFYSFISFKKNSCYCVPAFPLTRTCVANLIFLHSFVVEWTFLYIRDQHNNFYK
jgi:hypothetical protein